MDIQYKGIQKQKYPEQMCSETWISNTKVFLKHGYSVHRYSVNMDIQYTFIPQAWISSTNVFLKHGYPVQRYSEAKICRTIVFRIMDIQFKGIPQTW